MAGTAIVAMNAFRPPQAPLDELHTKIAREHPRIAHISADELVSGADRNVVVFDVREQEEFAVSHLDGATRVNPSLSATDFLKNFGASLSGKTVVFYCSVGVRSSKLAEKVRAAIATNTAIGDAKPAKIANLTKGVFGWRNEGRMLSRGSGETHQVHPYNDYWGRLINDRSAIAYTPAPAK